MKNTMVSNVKILLEADPKTRDNDGYLSSLYLYHYYNGTPNDFILGNVQISVVKTRQTLQKQYPNLQASKEVMEKRQAHSSLFKKEYRKQRSQEKPEELFTVAEDVSWKFKAETPTQYIARKIKSIFSF